MINSIQEAIFSSFLSLNTTLSDEVDKTKKTSGNKTDETETNKKISSNEMNNSEKVNNESNINKSINDTNKLVDEGENMNEKFDNKLKLIFEYEKHYLSLVKEYKEEIKFVNTFQEDLRREITQFFSKDLKEVAATLKESQVGDEVASKWIQELVQRYTDSINLCRGLANTQAVDTIGQLHREAVKAKELIGDLSGEDDISANKG